MLIGLAAFLFGGLTVDVFAPPPGAGNRTAVKITLLDLPGDHIKSDGRGTYIDGVDRVTAEIRDTGTLNLNTGSNTKPDRKVSLDYGDIVFGTGCNRLGDPGTEVPDLNCNGLADDPQATLTWGRLFTLDLNLLTIPAGQTRLGGFGVNFDDGCSAATHVAWRIRFQHQGTQDSVYSCGSACSAQVSVEAFDDDPIKGVPGTGVDKWIIMADLLAPGAAKACLWSGGTGDPVLREIVRMPFHLVVELK